MTRTNIAVDEELATSLADAATRQNKSLYALANEALGAVLRILDYGGRSDEVYPSWRFSRILKDTDAIPLPGDLMESLMKKTYASDKDWLMKAWFDEGHRIGSYLHMYAPKFQDLIPRVDEMQGFLPVKRVEIEPAKDADGTDRMSIRVIGAGMSIESTSCSEQFLKGILSAYSYKVVSDKLNEGFIELTAVETKRV